MRKIAAVAWDIDGTLVDSEPLHQAALEVVCDRHGVDVRSISDTFRGVHIFDVWKALAPRFVPPPRREEWIAQILRAYADGSSTLPVAPETRAVLAALARRGLRQVCVSNSHRVIVDANIRAMGIADMIEFSISLDDVKIGKPDPEPYATACGRLRLPPSAVVAIEDSATGARSARAAGLAVIGYSPSGESLADTDAQVTTLAHVPPLLEAWGEAP
jgi:HAD superfamily hydrolase (TIGR01509 family)